MTTKPAIPDEAVEAAAKAAYKVMPVELFGEDGPVLWEHLGGSILGNSRKRHELDRARAALQAAAPHMLKEAKRDGWDEGWQKAHATEDPPMAGIFFNPYR